MSLIYGAVIAREAGCLWNFRTLRLGRVRDPADVKQERTVCGRECSDALQHAVVVVARVVLTLDGKCGITHMVQHTVNQHIGWASKHVNVEPVEEFLQVLGLFLSKPVWIVEQEFMEGRGDAWPRRSTLWWTGVIHRPHSAGPHCRAHRARCPTAPCPIGVKTGEQPLADKGLDFFTGTASAAPPALSAWKPAISFASRFSSPPGCTFR